MVQKLSVTSAARSFSSVIAIGLLSLAVVALSGCTNADSENSSKIRLSLPDWNAVRQSAEAEASAKAGVAAKTSQQSVSASAVVPTNTVTSRIMINVSGEGIAQPIVYIWQRNDSGNDSVKDSGKDSSRSSAPQVIELAVPRGGARLVQVLALTKDIFTNAAGTAISSGPETFYYGDQVKDLASASENLDLSISRLDIGIDAAEGRVSGRWTDASDSGPTGTISIKFAPPNGRKSMIVSKSEIHGGWFDFFALEGAAFTYELDGGASVLGGGFKIGGADLLSGDARNLKVRVPGGYKSLYVDGTAVARVRDRAKLAVLGYFGPGSVGKKICYDSTAGLSIGERYLAADLSNSAQMTWGGAAAPTLATAGVVSGGEATAGGACFGDATEASRWTKWMNVQTYRLTDGGQIAGFFGPFQMFTPSGAPYRTILSAAMDATSTLQLEWRYLPGTTDAGRLGGVGVFTRVKSSSNNGNGGNYDFQTDDGIACNKLQELGFSLQARVPVQNAGVGSQQLSISGISTADFNNGRVEIIACPFSGSRAEYFANAAVRIGGASGTSGGAGPTPPVLYNLKATASALAPSTLISQQCNQIDIQPVDVLGVTPFSVPAGASVGINLYVSGTASGTLCSDAACTTCSVSSLTYNPGDSIKSVWYKPSSPGNANMNLSPGAMTGNVNLGLASQSTLFGVRLATPTAPYSVGTALVSPQPAVVNGQCYAVGYSLRDSSGNPTVVSSESVFVTPAVSGAPGSFYFNPGCTTAIGTSFPIPANNYQAVIYFKPAATGPFPVMGVTISGTTATFSGGTITNFQATSSLQIDRGDQAATYKLESMSGYASYLPVGSGCKAVRLHALSGGNADVLLPKLLTLTAGPGGQFFSSALGCVLGGSSTRLVVMTALSAYSDVIYVRESGANSFYVSIVDAANTSYLTGKLILEPPTRISMSGINVWESGVCKQVRFTALDANGVAVSGYPAPYVLTYTAGSNLTAYSDSACATALSSMSVAFPANSAQSGFVYIKAGSVLPVLSGIATVDYMSPEYTGISIPVLGSPVSY